MAFKPRLLPPPRPDRPAAPAHAGRPAIEVQGLTKAYGELQVLADLELSVDQGQIFGLLGSNGAGKTTAVEIIQGLRRPDRGRVRVLGLDPFEDRDRLRHLVGSQLQSSALPDRLRVGEALRLFARLADDAVDWQTLRDQWSLGHLERRPFGALSGGERQRLFLALALVNRPRLVFLDEITQGLDVAARNETWELIERVRDEGSTVVLVTHFMDEAERLCDRIGVLHGGRIVTHGRPHELITKIGGPTHLRFSCPNPADLDGLEHTPGVAGLSLNDDIADITCASEAVVPVTAELARRHLSPTDFTVNRPSLEDVFATLTAATTSTTSTEETDR